MQMIATNDCIETNTYTNRISDLAEEPRELLSPIEGYEKEPLVSLEECIEPIKKCFSSIENKVYIAKHNCELRSLALPIDQAASIMLYTMTSSNGSPFYYTLNSILRTNQPDRSEKLKDWFLYLKLFITALSQIPSYRGTVYRGVRCDLGDYYPENRKFVWWSFSSCTKTLKILESKLFLGNEGPATMFIIECFSGKEIREYSQYPKEDEVLLISARQFIVISRLNPRLNFWIIHVKEIEPPFPFLTMDSSISSTLEMIVETKPLVSDVITSTERSVSDATTSTHDSSNDDTFYSLPSALINTAADVLENIQSHTWPTLNKTCEKTMTFKDELILEMKAIDIAQRICENSQLKLLRLSNNSLNDKAFRHIIQSLIDRTNLRIYISDNRLTDESAIFLADILVKFPEIFSQIHINRNQFTAQGINVIFNALSQISNSTLRTLNLAGNFGINDDCIETISSFLQQNRSLKCLYLDQCNLTEDGKNRLRSITKNLLAFSLQL